MSKPRSDDAAFEAIFRESFAPVARSAYLVMGDWEAATEVAQDAFVQLLLHWRMVSGYDNPGAWVRRVAIRRAVRARWRDRRARGNGARSGLEAGAPEVSVDLRQALLRLSRTQRAAVVLHYLHDLPVKDVAAVLGCGEATAKTHLHRARQRLSVLLQEDKEDFDDAPR